MYGESHVVFTCLVNYRVIINVYDFITIYRINDIVVDNDSGHGDCHINVSTFSASIVCNADI